MTFYVCFENAGGILVWIYGVLLQRGVGKEFAVINPTGFCGFDPDILAGHEVLHLRAMVRLLWRGYPWI
jgi:hypothetical protein